MGETVFEGSDGGAGICILDGIRIFFVVVGDVFGVERDFGEIAEDLRVRNLVGKLDGSRVFAEGVVAFGEVAGADDAVALVAIGGHIYPAVWIGVGFAEDGGGTVRFERVDLREKGRYLVGMRYHNLR